MTIECKVCGNIETHEDPVNPGKDFIRLDPVMMYEEDYRIRKVRLCMCPICKTIVGDELW